TRSPGTQTQTGETGPLGVPEAVVLEHALALRMPEGLDLVQLLRSRQHLPHAPIVYLGPRDAELEAKVVSTGADAYVTLPTKPDVVRAYVEQLLSRRRAERDLREA